MEWSGSATSALLLRAESTQRDREQREKQRDKQSTGGELAVDDGGGDMNSSSGSASSGNGSGSSIVSATSSSRISPVQDAWQGLWARNNRAAQETGRGVDWKVKDYRVHIHVAHSLCNCIHRHLRYLLIILTFFLILDLIPYTSRTSDAL